MNAFKLLILLVFISFVQLDGINIQNGETVYIPRTIKINYNFTVPESETYKEALILTNINYTYNNWYYISITDEGKTTLYHYSPGNFCGYRLTSIKNKTITFEIAGVNYEFTLLDITKEINLDFKKFLSVIPYLNFMNLNFDPTLPYRFNIKEIDSDMTYYFINSNSNSVNVYLLEVVGNGVIEYCYDMFCVNNTYNASRIIHFKKGSHYKIRINYLKNKVYNLYYYLGLDGILYNGVKPLIPGLYLYNINKSNLQHIYIVDKKYTNQIKLYSKNHIYIQYSPINEDLVDNLPDSLEKMQFLFFNDFSNLNCRSYLIIILKDDEEYEKNIIYLYHYAITLTQSFKSYNLNKGNYSLIRTVQNLNKRLFISVECNKPSLKIINDTNGLEIVDNLTQVENQKLIIAYNEFEDIEIKIRYYEFEYNIYNYIKSWNNDRLDNLLSQNGNSDSIFIRVNSESKNYSFFSYLFFDLKSEYYLFINQLFGNVDVYKREIDDNTDLYPYLNIIKSYKVLDKFELINDHLKIITGSQLISTFLNYGFLGDIYIQKVDDNNIISLNKNSITNNLVKLLNPEKFYKISFHINHLIKLHNNFDDAIVTFYDENNNEIGNLNKAKKIIELSGENIQIKSDKNALIYFYSKIQPEKKLHEIIFDKEQTDKNMYFSIKNKNTNNEFIYIIKDFGFENHYPMLNSSSWIKIVVKKNKSTNIYITNPYDKLNNNFLGENEKYIIYIANVFDENGVPYFEEDQFEFGEIKYNKNSFNKKNKFNFQVIKTDEESSIVISQANKKGIYYEMIYCNQESYPYEIKIDYSNSNKSSYTDQIKKNITSYNYLQLNEIMNYKFYTNSKDINDLLFFFGFRNEGIEKNYYIDDNSYSNMTKIMSANYLYNNNDLIVSFNVTKQGYYKFYMIVAIEDENNNLDSFNNNCYLTKLITENTDSNYYFDIFYHYISDSFNLENIDISILNSDKNNNTKYVMNIISEELSNEQLGFGKPLEFIPKKIKEIYAIKQQEFSDENKSFFYKYDRDTPTKIIFKIKSRDKICKNCYILVKGSDSFTNISLAYDRFYFTVSPADFVYIEFEGEQLKGTFYLFPLNYEINITNFEEKNYFFEDEFDAIDDEKIFIYNIFGLTEDKMVYFIHDNNIYFKACEQIESTERCENIKLFYKFEANKYYKINVYGKQLTKYVFGVFNKKNILPYNYTGIIRKNEPNVYFVQKEKIDFDSCYLININSYFFFFSNGFFKKYSNEEELYQNLPNIDGFGYDEIKISDYIRDSFDYQKHFQIIVFPNFKSKSFEEYTIGMSQEFDWTTRNFTLKSGKNGFIDIRKEYNPLTNEYNYIRIIKSSEKNIKFVNIINDNNEYTDTLVFNSINNNSTFIYENYTMNDTFVTCIQINPRYTYMYVLNDYNLKNKIAELKEKGYNSYFKRINTDINRISDYFNIFTFSINNNVSIYIKKYYGTSNIYEINPDLYKNRNLSILEEPMKTYDKEISILDKLINIKSNQLYSGFYALETIYDIYIDFDDKNSTVIMQKENNTFLNLMKLFIPDIIFNLDFEVNHLIKLDPNFDTEVTIITEEKEIKLDKNNPTSTEVKGKNVNIISKSKAILYFYSPLSKMILEDKNVNIFQYKINIKNGYNLILTFNTMTESKQMIGCDIYYSIDVGFLGYSPLSIDSLKQMKKRCENYCYIFISNNYIKSRTKLVQGEELFIYYYFYNENENNIIADISEQYIPSLLNNKTDYNFLVIKPNSNDKDKDNKEQENIKNLLFNFDNKQNISINVNYCTNRSDEISMNYGIFNGKNNFTKIFNKSESFIISGDKYNLYQITFNSSYEFALSYSFLDKADELIMNSDSSWIKERKKNDYLIIEKAEIYKNKNILNIEFYANYLNSVTNYFIIIGPKNDNFTIDKYNNPCFLINLITDNSDEIIIYKFVDIGKEDKISKHINITDMNSKVNYNKEYVINIVSQELRFEKSLNFYRAKQLDLNYKIEINEDYIFNEKISRYSLSYIRSKVWGDFCAIITNSKFNSYKLIIERPYFSNIEYIIEKHNDTHSFPFSCEYGGDYYFNIISNSESPIQFDFKVISQRYMFSLDLAKNYYINFEYYISNNYGIDFNFTINTSNLIQASIGSFMNSNMYITIKDENNNKNILDDNNLFLFDKEKNYNIFAEFKLSYTFLHIEVVFFRKYMIDNLSFGNKIYSNLDSTFLKINYRETPMIFLKTNDNPKFYLSNISETNLTLFPQNINEIKFEQLEKLKIKKPNGVEYGILLIHFNSNESTLINITDKLIINIEYNYIYKIETEEDYHYNIKFDSNVEFEIIILKYKFDKVYSGEIIMENEVNKFTEKINNKLTGMVSFELSSKKLYSFYFKSSNNEKNTGEFKTLLTGKKFNANLEENIEFDKIESKSKINPLLLTVNSLSRNYIEKFDLESGKSSNFISIKKNDGQFIPLINNYYYFQKNNEYSIQMNFIEEGNNYILNPVKMLQISENNIEYLNSSKNITYKEINKDKFILFNFTTFSKLKINFNIPTFIVHKAFISENQYKIFPSEIEKINFEKIEDNDIEIEKKDNSNYGIVILNLKQSSDIQFNFGKKGGLTTLHIVLISVGSVLFIGIIIAVIIIVIKKKRKNNIETKMEEIKSELIEMKSENN